ncbi:MAG TPA: GNAT family protein [Candidatus Limnocylindria bacterium]|nr:GNAT family protein [Candidatus Limnocylindria bacterium]
MPDDELPSPHSVPILRSERIYLRPAERSDLPTFVRWFADAEMGRYLAIRAPFSMAMEEKWFDQMVERQGKDHYLFVICLMADGRPIGSTDLREIDIENGKAAFGIAIGEKREWGRGFGTEALNAICDFGFGQLRLERIELDVYADNARARRSYEKAGFQVEGTLRRGHFAEGEYMDVIRMSLLRAEWKALKRPKSWEFAVDEQPAGR